MVAPYATRPPTITSSTDNGFAPGYWGNGTWRLLHLAALTYPCKPTEDERRQVRTFFLSLQFVLPCYACRMGYAELLAGKLPLTTAALSSRDALFKWTVAIHNAVNAKLGKGASRSAAQWASYYEKMR